MSQCQVVVVGAGPAGLSNALALKDEGIQAVVVDQAEQVASSWRARYDRLRLNTCRPLSHLPGRRFGEGTPMFPTRDQVVEHLERNASDERIELRLGTTVHRVARDDGVWAVETSGGELRAPQLVIATGHQKEPLIPDWPGRESFQGELIHSAHYRNAEPFQGKRVLVVGPGCSGMEIAFDVAEGGAGKVWLSARTPPNIVLREGPGGIPGDMLGVTLLQLPPRFADAAARFGQRMGVGDLTEYGLPVPPEGVFSRLRRTGLAPAIVDKEVIEAVKGGRIEVVRGVESLDAPGVRLADGDRVEPDAIICATGYSPGLESLVGHLGVLDERGMPQAVGEKPAAQGLRFAGYVPRPGQLGYMGREARRVARAIKRELRGAGLPRARRETVASA
jgi:cation diffusion facilitator CzcD-associated flavoprotein CzcO